MRRTLTSAMVTSALAIGALASMTQAQLITGTPVPAVPLCTESQVRLSEPFTTRGLAGPFTGLCVIAGQHAPTVAPTTHHV
jgi:hypothetical protein